MTYFTLVSLHIAYICIKWDPIDARKDMQGSWSIGDGC